MLEVEIGPGLHRLGTPIEREFGYAALFQIPELYQDEWKRQALETRSYRSGAYYRNIHRSPNAVLSVGGGYRDVISDVGYGEIIESIGWTTQPGRLVAEKAIEAAEPDVERILTDAADKVIDEIEG